MGGLRALLTDAQRERDREVAAAEQQDKVNPPQPPPAQDRHNHTTTPPTTSLQKSFKTELRRREVATRLQELQSRQAAREANEVSASASPPPALLCY